MVSGFPKGPKKGSNLENSIRKRDKMLEIVHFILLYFYFTKNADEIFQYPREGEDLVSLSTGIVASPELILDWIGCMQGIPYKSILHDI